MCWRECWGYWILSSSIYSSIYRGGKREWEGGMREWEGGMREWEGRTREWEEGTREWDVKDVE